jgi:hypothetical protein
LPHRRSREFHRTKLASLECSDDVRRHIQKRFPDKTECDASKTVIENRLAFVSPLLFVRQSLRLREIRKQDGSRGRT